MKTVRHIAELSDLVQNQHQLILNRVIAAGLNLNREKIVSLNILLKNFVFF